MMTTTRDWSRNKEMWIGVLEKQTGEGLEAWKAKMRSTNSVTNSNCEPGFHGGTSPGTRSSCSSWSVLAIRISSSRRRTS